MINPPSDNKPAWCPGCGNFPILKVLDRAIEDAGIDRRRLVLVSGIGQAAKTPHYTRANVFNGLHGRALPAATGIKLANHDLEVVVTSGDGDMYGEGAGHLLHTFRRNIGVKMFVHNNQVYGLTKGQASPTSDPGFVTKIQTHGVILAPVRPLALAIVEDCSLVARSFAGDQEHLEAMMVAALKHTGGTVLLDILQPCISFNRINTLKWYKERVRPVGDEHDSTDRAKALDLALTWGDEIPIGIIYRSDRPSFESRLGVLEKGTLVGQFAAAAGGC
jgi:2-oxoglutarate ferredoxin oxidoreductase subunit beta